MKMHSHTLIPATHRKLYLPLSSAAKHHHPLAGTYCTYPWRDGQAELTCHVIDIYVTNVQCDAPDIDAGLKSLPPLIHGLINNGLPKV